MTTSPPRRHRSVAPAAVRVALTPEERSIASWAIDPMQEYFEDLVREGECTQVPPLPTLTGSILVLPEDKDAQEDFLYRVLEQYKDMVDQRVEDCHGIVPRNYSDAVLARIRRDREQSLVDQKAQRGLARKLRKVHR